MPKLSSKRGLGNSFEWKSNLRKNIAISDFLSLVLTLLVILTIRFPDTWNGNLNDYEVRNILLGILVIFSWLFFLWFNGSRDTNILGFGADEYKRLTNASLLSFTFIAFISYIFKLEISRAFVLLVFPFGLAMLFITRRILRRRLLKARANGRYLSRVLLFHSGSSDPVEARLAIAQHAGFNIVKKIVTAENFKFDFKELLTYGSFIVSLSVAYYTHEIRIVKLESETQQDRKVVQEIKEELREIKADVKQLLIKVK